MRGGERRDERRDGERRGEEGRRGGKGVTMIMIAHHHH